MTVGDLADERQRGAVAGLVASGAMALAMLLDMRMTRERTNEFQLIGALAPSGARTWPVVGPVLHGVNGAALGAVFGLTHHGLPGPLWVRGLLFGQAENLILWPVIVVLDRLHPAIRQGALPRFNRPVVFLQEVFRHVVYGVTLGLVYDRLSR